MKKAKTRKCSFCKQSLKVTRAEWDTVYKAYTYYVETHTCPNVQQGRKILSYLTHIMK